MADFLAWCAAAGLTSFAAVQPLHIATYIEQLTQEVWRSRRRPSSSGCRDPADVRLACDRPGCAGQPVRIRARAFPRRQKGKTPALSPHEGRRLLDSIDASTPIGLRDRSAIGVMVYSLPVSARQLRCASMMSSRKNRPLWIRLREKGGKRHATTILRATCTLH